MMLTKLCQSALAGLFIAALAACATPFPKNFDPNSGQVLIVGAGPTPAGANSYIFRRIDRATGQFVGDVAGVMHYTGSHFLLQRSDAEPDYLFTVMPAPNAARTYPPGEYAFIAVNNNTGTIVPSGTAIVIRDQQGFTCNQDRAPTFTVRSGEIIIVPVNGLDIAAADLLAEFERTRARYPEIVGVARVAEMQAPITFGGEAPLSLSACMNAVNFQPAP